MVAMPEPLLVEKGGCVLSVFILFETGRYFCGTRGGHGLVSFTYSILRRRQMKMVSLGEFSEGYNYAKRS